MRGAISLVLFSPPLLVVVVVACGGGGGGSDANNAPRVNADASALTRCFATAYDNASADKDAAFASCEEKHFGTEWRQSARPREGAPLGSGYLDAEIVRAGINARMHRMKTCYADGLRRDSSLRGEMKIRFVIDTTGHAINVEDAGSRMKDKQVVTCVMKEFSALRFPSPQGGIVNVLYPLLIAPGDTSTSY